MLISHSYAYCELTLRDFSFLERLFQDNFSHPYRLQGHSERGSLPKPAGVQLNAVDLFTVILCYFNKFDLRLSDR